MKRIKTELAAMGELLRHIIDNKGVSHRKVQDRVRERLQKQSGGFLQTVGSTIRVKLRKGQEWRLSYAEVLLILEAIDVDSADFLAMLAKVGKPSLALFGPIKTDHWTQEQRKILRAVAAVKARGSEGYLEARAELKDIELMRDEDPQAAEAAAWAFLETSRKPGALVGALAILAVEAPCGNAQRLCQIAFDLLGSRAFSTAAGFKLVTSMGRSLYVSGLYQEALDVLDKHAIRLAGLFGTVDEIALVNYYIGISASRMGDIATCRQSLEQCFTLGGDRWKFAALQLLALLELNSGDIQRAAGMYDELVSLPYFAVAEPRSKVCVEWSRMGAYFLAGKLGPGAEEEYRRVVAATRDFLDIQNQMAATLDLALFLRSIGKDDDARDLLKAERWNMLGLEEGEIRQNFVAQWEALDIPESPFGLLELSPKEAKPRPLRLPASLPYLGQVPGLPAEGPTE